MNGLIARAIRLYEQSGHKMHWFDFYCWGKDNGRLGFDRYINKALEEIKRENKTNDTRDTKTN